MKRTALAVCSLAALQLAYADCSEAVDQYNTAVSEISYALKRYTSCVAGSHGDNDCSSEFRRLRNAQSEFEYAVSEYQIECD